MSYELFATWAERREVEYDSLVEAVSDAHALIDSHPDATCYITASQMTITFHPTKAGVAA